MKEERRAMDAHTDLEDSKERRMAIRLLCILLLAGFAGCRMDKQEDGSLQFKSLRPGVTELLTMALDPDDADKRREGICGLSQHSWGLQEKVAVTDEKGKTKEVEVLKVYHLIATTDKDPTVRAVALNALGRSGNAKYLGTVLRCLDDDVTAVRWEAAVALDRVIGPAAVKPLTDHALRDESMDVRAMCAKAMRNYPRRDVMETLCQVLTDREFTVRFQAHESLVKLTGKDAQYDADDWRSALAHLPLATSQPK